MLDVIGSLWNELLIRPMVNSLVLIYALLLNNFGLSILVFTGLIRLATLPLTLRQIRQTRAMTQLQPRIAELRKRYANDRQRMSQETFRIYKEQGVSPIGCLGPLVVQMPIFIALYWSLLRLLPDNPETLANLSGVLYSWLGVVHSSIPIKSSFLGLDLARTPQQIGGVALVFIPLLVGASMWVQQKMMTAPNSDPRQQQSQQMMLWMFPILFGFITLQFASGLALYWIATNLMGIAIQYRITGLSNLLPRRPPLAASAEPQAPSSPSEPTVSGAMLETPPVEEDVDHGQQPGEDGEIRRRSRGASPKGPRRRTRRGRGGGRQSR